MDGDRNLTEASLVPFMRGLKLNKQEQEFFRNLVFFNQAKTHEQRDIYYQRLLQSRKFSQLKPLEREQYEYYSNWYHPVVRELIASKEFDGSPEWISQRIFPPITPAQAHRSIELLEKLSLIKKIESNRWRQTSPVVTTGPEVTSLVLFNYHHGLLDLTKEILHKVKPEQRDVSALTLGIGRSKLSELKQKIREFREEILKWVSTETDPEEVVQVDIQMYPLTRREEGDK